MGKQENISPSMEQNKSSSTTDSQEKKKFVGMSEKEFRIFKVTEMRKSFQDLEEIRYHKKEPTRTCR